ncbi:MAG: hypothetical protein ACC652_05600 [Acidimicrobiales bacterium]
MLDKTRKAWARQDHHKGDRWRLFRAVSKSISPELALYPGSFVDIAPSFVFASVVYVDRHDRARDFFDDADGVREIVAEHDGSPPEPQITFIHGDYREDLDIERGSVDLLISLYGGFVSESCTTYLRIGGTLLVNASRGDVALVSLDSRYELRGAVQSRSGDYRVSTDALDGYLQAKSGERVTHENVLSRGRGVGYTKSAFAYLFERVS